MQSAKMLLVVVTCSRTHLAALTADTASVCAVKGYEMSPLPRLTVSASTLALHVD